MSNYYIWAGNSNTSNYELESGDGLYVYGSALGSVIAPSATVVKVYNEGYVCNASLGSGATFETLGGASGSGVSAEQGVYLKLSSGTVLSKFTAVGAGGGHGDNFDGLELYDFTLSANNMVGFGLGKNTVIYGYSGAPSSYLGIKGLLSGGTLYSDASLVVSSGAIIRNVYTSGGYVSLQSGASADGLVADGEFRNFGNAVGLNAGADLRNFTLMNNNAVGLTLSAAMTIHNYYGGKRSYAVLSGTISGGAQFDGYLRADAGATMADYCIQSGSVAISSDAMVERITVSGGMLTVNGGASVKDLICSSGTVTLNQGTEVQGLTVYGGAITASNGASIQGLNLLSSGMTLSPGASVDDLHIGNGYAGYINSGVSVTGQVDIAGRMLWNGGLWTAAASRGVFSNAVINFALDEMESAHSSDDPVCMYSLPNAIENVTYQVTVDAADQAIGTFYLTAWGYTGTITVKSSDGTTIADDLAINTPAFIAGNGYRYAYATYTYKSAATGGKFTVEDYRVEELAGGATIFHGSALADVSLDGTTVSALRVRGTGEVGSVSMVGANVQLDVYGGTVGKLDVAQSTASARISGGAVESATVSAGLLQIGAEGAADFLAVSGGTATLASGTEVSTLHVGAGGTATLASGAEISTLHVGSGARQTLTSGAHVDRIDLAGQAFWSGGIWAPKMDLSSTTINFALNELNAPFGALGVDTCMIHSNGTALRNIITVSADQAEGEYFLVAWSSDIAYSLYRENSELALTTELSVSNPYFSDDRVEYKFERRLIDGAGIRCAVLIIGDYKVELYDGAGTVVEHGKSLSDKVIGGAEFASGAVFAGGALSSAAILAGGKLELAGTVSDSVISTGAALNIAAGGTLINATAESGAHVNVVKDGGNATFRGAETNIAEGALYFSGAAIAGRAANGVFTGFNATQVFKLSFGDDIIVSNVSLNESEIRISCFGGASVDTAHVSAGAIICNAGASGTINSVTLEGAGIMNLSGTVQASSTVVKAGGHLAFNAAGASADDTTLLLGGNIVTSNLTGSANTGNKFTLAFEKTEGTMKIDLSKVAGSTTIYATGVEQEGHYILGSGGTVAKVTQQWGLYANEIIADGFYEDALNEVTYSFDGTKIATSELAIRTGAAAGLSGDNYTALRTNDRAAKWTEAADNATLVTENFSGDAYLTVAGDAAKAIYGAGVDFAGTVNIDAKSGTIRNLAAGAEAGKTVGAVKLTFDGATLAGAGYAGGFGNVTGETETLVSTGTFAKDFYAGALANKLATATGVGDVSMTIDGGTFDGNIFGASAVKTDSTVGTGTRHTAGNVTLTITNGETTKGAQACIFAGGYATGDATGTVYTVDSVTATISGGDWGEAAGGRGVFGGIMASGVEAEVLGNVNITISGDATMGNVYGGGWAQKTGGKSIVGDVSINIAGGTIANVFGGGTHSTSGGTTEAGEVTITVSGGDISGAIYARGQLEGDTTGTAAVIFTGATDFGCGVFGYSYVGGAASDAALSFSGYTGEFSGNIGGFDSITFDKATEMDLTTAAGDVSNGAWIFDLTERGAGLADSSLLTWSSANFENDSVKVSFADDAQAQGGWNIAAVAEAFSGTTFEVEVAGTEIATGLAYNQQIASGDYAGWGFELESGVLKFKQLA